MNLIISAMSQMGKKLSLYVNKELVQEIEIPSFPALSTVVSDTEKEIFIKLVNLAEEGR